jgi:hypothetical protein
MSMRKKHRWVRIVQPKQGHEMRFFQDERGKWSACDWSGNNPDQTDDGPLWLPDRRVVSFAGGSPTIQVLQEGDLKYTGISPTDVTWLCTHLGYTIQMEGLVNVEKKVKIPYRDKPLGKREEKL